MSFKGFDPAAISLLSRLPDMSVGEYADHKATLAAGLTKPGAALIADVANGLDADLTIVPRGSVSPLHRDLRFAGEGAPRYKDHLLLTTWEGPDKKTSPTFWIRVDAEQVGFASGIGFTPAARERWRKRVGGAAGQSLAAELAQLQSERGADVSGDQVKRVPAPFDVDHPRADLLRHTGFQVRFAEPMPSSIDSPSFAGWCTERLDALLPVHRWLLANVAG
jgi:uncharacterized protein (DUF2461 family)